MKSRTQLVVVLTLTLAADLIIRFGSTFDFARAMHGEAILFTLTAGVLLLLHRRSSETDGLQNRWGVIVIWFFGLGALRCILWTIGIPLTGANFATLGVLGVVILVWWLTRGQRKKVDSVNGGSGHSLK